MLPLSSKNPLSRLLKVDDIFIPICPIVWILEEPIGLNYSECVSMLFWFVEIVVCWQANFVIMSNFRLITLCSCKLLKEEKAIERGILPLLQRATLVQTFGQQNHVCLKESSITIPPYAPPQKMQAHLIPERTPRSIFVYFRGLFYDVGNDPEGGYYARYFVEDA